MHYLTALLSRIAVIYFSSIVFSLGQIATTTATSTVSTASAPVAVAPVSQSVTAYQQGQQALVNGMVTLLANGATPQQIGAWQAQNSTAIAAQQQQAVALANSSSLQSMPTLAQPNISANASLALSDFSTLTTASAPINNQLSQQTLAPAQSLTTTQTAQTGLQETQTLSPQPTGALQLQAQPVQAVINTAPVVIAALPATPSIPATTSPQVASFLNAKYQLMLSQIQVLNQNAAAAPSVQAAALQQWQQQNASALAQLQQLEANLPSQISSPQN